MANKLNKILNQVSLGLPLDDVGLGITSTNPNVREAKNKISKIVLDSVGTIADTKTVVNSQVMDFKVTSALMAYRALIIERLKENGIEVDEEE